MRLIRNTLVAAALVAGWTPGSMAQAWPEDGALSPAQRDEVLELVSGFILANPEVLERALNLLETRRSSAYSQAETLAQAGLTQRDLLSHGDAVSGNASGDLTVVYFSDFTCPFCRIATRELLAAAGVDGRVRIIHKETPLLAPEARMAAVAAKALAQQGNEIHARFHAILMGRTGALTEEKVLAAVAQAVGDIRKLAAAAKDPATEASLDRDRALAIRLGGLGTPLIVIGDRIIRGHLTQAAFLAEFSRERERRR